MFFMGFLLRRTDEQECRSTENKIHVFFMCNVIDDVQLVSTSVSLNKPLWILTAVRCRTQTHREEKIEVNKPQKGSCFLHCAGKWQMGVKMKCVIFGDLL